MEIFDVDDPLEPGDGKYAQYVRPSTLRCNLAVPTASPTRLRMTEALERQGQELQVVLPVPELRGLIQLYAYEDPLLEEDKPKFCGSPVYVPPYERARRRLPALLLAGIAMAAFFVLGCAFSLREARAYQKDGEEEADRRFFLAFALIIVVVCWIPLALGFPLLYTCLYRLRHLRLFDPAPVAVPPAWRMSELELKQARGSLGPVALLYSLPTWLILPLLCLFLAPPLPFEVTSYSHLLQTQPLMADYDIVRMAAGSDLGVATQFTFYDQRSGVAIAPIVREGSAFSLFNLTHCPVEAASGPFPFRPNLWAVLPAANTVTTRPSPAPLVVIRPQFLGVRTHGKADYVALATEAAAIFGLPFPAKPTTAEVTVFKLHAEEYPAAFLLDGSLSGISAVLGFTLLCGFFLLLFLRRCAGVYYAFLQHRAAETARYWEVPPALISSSGEEGELPQEHRSYRSARS